MFKDPRARRAWTLYFLRAEAALSSLQAAVRNELLADLKAHVQDIMDNDKSGGDELARLKAALGRVGSPKEFLEPLLAGAVFKAPPRYGSVGMAYRTAILYASRGAIYAARAATLAIAAVIGAAAALAALNSLLRPTQAGVFQLGPDDYQVRILGAGSALGEQLLAPWMAVVLCAAGALLVYWTATKARRMLMELVAGAG